MFIKIVISLIHRHIAQIFYMEMFCTTAFVMYITYALHT